MGKQIFYLIIFLPFLSCNRQKEPGLQRSHALKIVETKGHIVLLDTMPKPRVTPVIENELKKTAIGNPQIVSAISNIHAAGKPAVVTAGKPVVCVPGRDSFLLPEIVLAVDSPFIAGIPDVVEAKEAAVKDQNPQNFSNFGTLQGLNQNYIDCILQDRYGNLWIGTFGGGVTKYDGKSFTHYTTKQGLSDNRINSMLEDKSGNLWFGTRFNGVTKFDGKQFTHYGTKEGLSHDFVFYMLQDRQGNIWFCTWGGGITKYDGKYFTRFGAKQGLCNDIVFYMCEDHIGNLWFGTSAGVSKYDGKSFENFTAKQGLSSSNVPAIYEDPSGRMWFGNAAGLSIYDGKCFMNYSEKEGLNNNNCTNIMYDKAGNYWLGTDGGIAQYDGNSFTRYTVQDGLNSNIIWGSLEDKSGGLWFSTPTGLTKFNGLSFTHLTTKEGLSNNVIISIIKDRKGNLWFGTSGSGVSKYDGKSFTHFSTKNGLSSNTVYSMAEDLRGNIWFSGGGVCKYDGKSFTHITTKEGLSATDVCSILADKNGNLWFGSYGIGVTKYDGKSLTIYTKKEGLVNDNIYYMCEDRKGNIWFATDGGVSKFDGKSFTNFTEADGLGNNIVWSILEDKKGNMWFGTNGGGASEYDGKSFVSFTEREGLSNNIVNTVFQDRNDAIWFGTGLGLSKLTALKQDEISAQLKSNSLNDDDVFFKNFTYEDGFLGISCKRNAMCETGNGNIWIGTSDRLTVYHPTGGDVPDTIAPHVQLTNIELYNENIPWQNLLSSPHQATERSHARDTSILLGNGIRAAGFEFEGVSPWYGLPEHLSLAYNNNYLTFSFVGIALKSPKKVKYKYKLDGLDENWSALTGSNQAHYGNIPDGTFTFVVKAMNSEGYWSPEFHYTFTIRPPWWKTWWFSGAVVLLIIGAIIFYINWRERALKQRQKALEQTVEDRTIELVKEKKQVEAEKVEAERQRTRAEQSEHVKQMFLANMSHEIRTPLNAIVGITRLLLDEAQESKSRRYLRTVKNACDNLLVIINDLLDLSKIEAGKLRIEKIGFSLRQQILLVQQMFDFKAKEKGLKFIVNVSAEADDMLTGDPHRLNQVLINMLANAFKFTEQGQVSLEVNKRGEKLFVFKISDTGIGIAEDKLELIFDSFKQAENSTSRNYGGTGLGLSISQRLVAMMGGEIAVKSKPGEGSEFTFVLPFEKAEKLEKPKLTEKEVSSMAGKLTGMKILLAEDNGVNRMVAVDTIRKYMPGISLSVVNNGAEAIEKVKVNNFDLVLMDVHMPIVDGYRATEMIRNIPDEQKNSVAILAMTASVIGDDITRCLECGMNGYIPKPFTPEKLVAEIYKVKFGTVLTLEEQDSDTETGVQPDSSYLENFTGGSKEKIKKYVLMFRQEIPPLLTKMDECLAQNDIAGLYEALHSLKPQIEFMGAKSAFVKVENLEKILRNMKSPDEITGETLHELRDEVINALRYWELYGDI